MNFNDVIQREWEDGIDRSEIHEKLQHCKAILTMWRGSVFNKERIRNKELMNNIGNIQAVESGNFIEEDLMLQRQLTSNLAAEEAK